jgi:N-carbamoylputrescine amidase
VKVTVCELPSEPAELAEVWPRLVGHVRAGPSDLVLLPEMVFSRWLGRERPEGPDRGAAKWQAAVAAHDAALARLSDLAPAWVLGSRPVTLAGRRANAGFLCAPDGTCALAHFKRYLPDEPGFWEASWYDRGDGRFKVARAGAAQVGFLICTDLWFPEHARALGRAGAQVIANPRATERATVDKWLAGGRVAAVVAGAFCLSSNHVGGPGGAVTPMGGQGWVVSPDGDVLALTSPERPWVTVTIDLAEAEHARKTYPRYVAE